MLTDAAGKLLFSGGITASRGHVGDNAGLDALILLIRNTPAPSTARPVITTPVFGCAIRGPEETP